MAKAFCLISMTPSGRQQLSTPVAVFVFNRPSATIEVMKAVRWARPPTLFVVADGPRQDHPTDIQRCAKVRAIATDADWPCDVHILASDTNLGCDVRVQTGLDWIFSQVEQAIIVEDDVVPHASMFPWCENMLALYTDDPSIAMVAARNPLGRWGPADADHLVARRGSIHGWATWARAWTTLDRTWPDRDPGQLAETINALHLPPLVKRHLERTVSLAQNGRLAAWDNHWDATHMLADTWAAISPVNLTRNIGFGGDATRTTNADDLRASMPVFSAPPATLKQHPQQPDPDFDEASLIVDLLAGHVRPEITRRLAQRPHLIGNENGILNEDLLLQLAPMMDPHRSLSIVRHLQAAGAASTALDRLLAALTDVEAAPS